MAGQHPEKQRKCLKKIERTDGKEDFPVLSRFPAEQGPALHLQVFGLKHDAKLRHCDARQFSGLVIFSRTANLNFYFRPNGLNDELFDIFPAVKKNDGLRNPLLGKHNSP